LHAADAAMAIENARDVYTRRQEGVSIWVVESKQIIASNPEEAGELYEPAVDKIYRHPTFYNLPDEVNHM
jgi:ring-1,2-phenylacetyl-CoA epoxidase subunit PaaB